MFCFDIDRLMLRFVNLMLYFDRLIVRPSNAQL